MIKTAVIITLTSEKIDREYLLNFLKAKNELLKTFHGGQAIKKMISKKFLELKIFVPPLERQIEINKKIKDLEINLINTSAEINDIGKLRDFYRYDIFNRLRRIKK